MENQNHDPRSPQYWREHYQLDRLPIGGTVDVRGGYVVRVRPQEYCLHSVQIRHRARWGTAEQIAEDVAYIEAWGVLPPPNGVEW